MERRIALLMILLLAAALFAGAVAEPVILPVRQAPEENLAVTREEALEKALELFAEHGHDYIEGQYFRKAGSVLLPDGRNAWIVFIERRDEEAAGNLYALLSADTGDVIEQYCPDNDVYTWILTQWTEAKNRHMADWSPEDQELFSWLFTEGGSRPGTAQI